MQLKLFLDQLRQENFFLEKKFVVPFVYPKEYVPIVFGGHLLSFLKEKNNTFEIVDMQECELSHIISCLETSFLGMKIGYWLRGFENKDKKFRQQLIQYLSEYRGPHQVLFMCGDDDIASYQSKMDYIEIPATISSDIARSLVTMFKKMSTSGAKYISEICAKFDNVSLDEVCMLAGYIQVVSNQKDYTAIVDCVVKPEHSLFTLAQHFFAKNCTDFYKLWYILGPTYPITFWCVYWSEQLWRAYHVRYYMAKGQLSLAKATSARLPFSFLQKDWKKVSLQELKNAHQWMYDLDRAYKNNIETEIGIDLFYNKFFLNEFANN